MRRLYSFCVLQPIMACSHHCLWRWRQEASYLTQDLFHVSAPEGPVSLCLNRDSWGRHHTQTPSSVYLPALLHGRPKAGWSGGPFLPGIKAATYLSRAWCSTEWATPSYSYGHDGARDGANVVIMVSMMVRENAENWRDRAVAQKKWDEEKVMKRQKFFKEKYSTEEKRQK